MSEEERKETLREAKILEVLNHPNITRFREVYKTKKGKALHRDGLLRWWRSANKSQELIQTKDSPRKALVFRGK